MNFSLFYLFLEDLYNKIKQHFSMGAFGERWKQYFQKGGVEVFFFFFSGALKVRLCQRYIFVITCKRKWFATFCNTVTGASLDTSFQIHLSCCWQCVLRDIDNGLGGTGPKKKKLRNPAIKHNMPTLLFLFILGKKMLLYLKKKNYKSVQVNILLAC